MSDPTCTAVLASKWAVVEASLTNSTPKICQTFPEACALAFEMAKAFPGEYHIMESTFVVSSPGR